MTEYGVEIWIKEQLDSEPFNYLTRDEIEHKIRHLGDGTKREAQYKGFINGSMHSGESLEKKYGKKSDRTKTAKAWKSSGAFFSNRQTEVSEWLKASVDENEKYKSTNLKKIKKSYSPDRLDSISFDKDKYHEDTIQELKDTAFTRSQKIQMTLQDLDNRLSAATTLDELQSIGRKGDFADFVDQSGFMSRVNRRYKQLGLSYGSYG